MIRATGFDIDLSMFIGNRMLLHCSSLNKKPKSWRELKILLSLRKGH